jgi:LPXTG-site transpeptidase (sortase) family protein
LVDRVHVSRRLLGEVLVAVLLTVSLAFTWRDGVPTDGYVDTSGPSPSGIAAMQVVSLAGRLPVVAPAPAPQPLVPTAQPVELLIPSLDVHRPVEMVGTDQFGVMNLPVNAWNGGWYTGSPVPGAPGDAVIEGHAGYPGKPMMFGKLATLHRGDRIIVVLADGSKQLFLVVSIRIVPIGLAPPGMAAYTGPARLTLITCTGSFDKKSYSYSNRLLLEARYAGLA